MLTIHAMTLKERLDIYERLMRLDKPIGILLLMAPALWGVWMASWGAPTLAVIGIFVLGVVLMRSAGCVINDFADRNFDPHVERTRERPLAARLISPAEALLVAGVLVALAFGLVLQLNLLTIKLSVIALGLTVMYPFLKRFFWLPQAWLGIAFGFSIPMAFAAHHNHIVPLAWTMLVANMFWAIAYDTEYAMVDREDDIKLGLKSSAILFGRYDVAAVMVCHAVFLLIMAYIGYRARLGAFYYLGLAAAAIAVGCQFRLIRGRERERCFKAFVNNAIVGLAVFAGIVADFWMRVPLYPGQELLMP